MSKTFIEHQPEKLWPWRVITEAPGLPAGCRFIQAFKSRREARCYKSVRQVCQNTREAIIKYGFIINGLNPTRVKKW